MKYDFNRLKLELQGLFIGLGPLDKLSKAKLSKLEKI